MMVMPGWTVVVGLGLGVMEDWVLREEERWGRVVSESVDLVGDEDVDGCSVFGAFCPSWMVGNVVLTAVVVVVVVVVLLLLRVPAD